MYSIQGVLYLRNEKEELRWFEDVDPNTEDGKYVGQIKNGEPCGHGTFTYPNGEKYEGEWKDAKLYGQGVYIGFYGEKYEGKWKHGIYHGKGIYTFSDGIKWIGEWREDKPWNITEYSKDGKVNGKMVNGVQ